jgi:DNA polymerase III subunit chi
MSHVFFYFNIRDRPALFLRLATQALEKGRALAVHVQDEQQGERIDRWLWTHEAGSFLPHVPRTSPWAAQTPIVWGHEGDGGTWPRTDVVINLSPAPVVGASTFSRVIELVGKDPDDREKARARWAFYRAEGLPIYSKDMDEQETSP